jgi:hypothetical protein
MKKKKKKRKMKAKKKKKKIIFLNKELNLREQKKRMN